MLSIEILPGLSSCKDYNNSILFCYKMTQDHIILEKIRPLVISKNYRIKIHAIRHMIEEGFSEGNIIEAIENGKILENYTDEKRCLIVGSFYFTETTTSPLHVICDYTNSEIIDIITAYIPQKPWWISPNRRGKIK